MLKKCVLKDILARIPNKRIFLRNDFNVPLKETEITNASRIEASLPTIKDILSQNPKSLIMASHLGRPNGQVVDNLSLLPVRDYLEDTLRQRVELVKDYLSASGLANLQNGSGIYLLENLRFNSEEEGKIKKDGKKIKVDKQFVEDFRNKLTSFSDIFVNDAFGTMHRAHSSIVGIHTDLRVAGNLVQKELEYFGKALETKHDKFVVILGGAKVSDKIPVIKNILNLASDIIVGGGMTFTFLKSLKGINIGTSLLDKEHEETVKELKNLADSKNVKIHLPVDIKAQNDLGEIKTFNLQKDNGIPSNYKGLDIGPETIEYFSSVLNNSNLMIMNGPMGMFEKIEFAEGSYAIAKKMAEECSRGGIGIVGGGDTSAMVDLAGYTEKMSHVSTGGGASLELLSGKVLPGVNFLSEKSEL